METALLQNDTMKAVFAIHQGMNLVQLRKGKMDLIDPNTQSLFAERLAGLGSLIGPHFYHRPLSQIPNILSEDAFPHLAKIKAKGVQEPFSHGIGRYVPWNIETSQDAIRARLSGKDLYKGMELASLEGFDFEMSFEATLLENGLCIDYSVESDKPSVIGLHYYYTLPKEGGTVQAAVEPMYRVQDKWTPIPSSLLDGEGNLYFDALQEADFGFIPKKKAGFFEVLYTNPEFSLRIRFETQDGSWQLYRPKDASYVCLEPLSAKDPKNPTLTKSRLKILIEVV